MPNMVQTLGGLAGRAVGAMCVLGLVSAIAFCAGGCGKRQSEAPAAGPRAGVPAPVIVSTAAVEKMTTRIEAVGAAEAINTVIVRPRIEGEVTQIHFEDGQDVKVGEMLFTIDPQPFAAAVHLAEANLARDKALAANAESLAKENEQAYKKNAVALRDLEDSRFRADSAAATVRAEEAALETAQLQLGYCTIRSPLDGKAGDRQTDAGNIVVANVTPLVTINQIAPIYVTFSVPEQHLLAIQAGMAAGPLPVEATVSETRAVEYGVLTFVGNQVDPATGTIRLKGTFANKGHPLWPGQFVNASLVLATTNAIMVPSVAIQHGSEGEFVYVVRPDDTVESRPVATGKVVKTSTVIRSGLSAGEMVVAEGQLRLRPGARVQIKGHEPVSRPATSTATGEAK